MGVPPSPNQDWGTTPDMLCFYRLCRRWYASCGFLRKNFLVWNTIGLFWILLKLKWHHLQKELTFQLSVHECIRDILPKPAHANLFRLWSGLVSMTRHQFHTKKENHQQIYPQRRCCHIFLLVLPMWTSLRLSKNYPVNIWQGSIL